MEAIYLEGMQPKEWGKPTFSIYAEHRVISDGLSRVLSIQDMMIHYGPTWLKESLKQYSSMVVRDFHASYVPTIKHSLHMGKKPLTQPILIDTKVRSLWVDISEETIHRILFGPEYRSPRSIADFDYRVGQARNPLIMKDTDHRATLLRWLASHIVE